MIPRRCLLAVLAFGLGVAGSARVASTHERLSSMGHFISGLTLANLVARNHLPATLNGVATGAAYDAQGNLTTIWPTPGASASQLTMTYDALGRVAALGDTKNATSQTYGYDDEGLRIKTFDSKTGLIAYNIYDEGRRLIAQYEVSSGGSLTWKKDFFYVGNREVAEVDSAGKTWVQFLDHLSSPRFEWDGTPSPVVGTNLISQKYAPFGEYLNDPTTQGRFGKGFTNHEQTDASGLIYMQARFYLPMYGRFASEDPYNILLEKEKGRTPEEKNQILLKYMSNPQVWNKYAYVLGNPVSNSDPDGRRELTAEDRARLEKLKQYAAEHKDVAGAINKAIGALQNAIAAVPQGKSDPAGLKAAMWSVGQIGNSNFGLNGSVSVSSNGNTLSVGGGSWKCNIFVAAAYSEGAGIGLGGSSGYPVNGRYFGLGSLWGSVNAPAANDLANPGASIANFSVTSSPGVGAVTAFRSPEGMLGHSTIGIGGGALVYASTYGVKVGTVEQNMAGHSAVTYREYKP